MESDKDKELRKLVEKKQIICLVLFMLAIGAICVLGVVIVMAVKLSEGREKRESNNDNDDEIAGVFIYDLLPTDPSDVTTGANDAATGANDVTSQSSATDTTPGNTGSQTTNTGMMTSNATDMEASSSDDATTETGATSVAETTNIVTTTEAQTTAMPTTVMPEMFMGSECQQTSAAMEYNGTVSTTVNGHTCQRWDSQTPHIHPFDTDHFFRGETITEAMNYCRNPDGDQQGAWCYTTDPDTVWEYCTLPDCDETEPMPEITSLVHDCVDIWDLGIRRNGVYMVDVMGHELPVNCDLEEAAMGTEEGGWTLIQRRVDGSVSFEMDWLDFWLGFGDVYGNYWQSINVTSSILTSMYMNDANYAVYLHFQVEDFSGNTGWALYRLTNYTFIGEMNMEFVNGTAGDAMAECTGTDLDPAPFTAPNGGPGTESCAEAGSFWHPDTGTCCSANLNGPYRSQGTPYFLGSGIFWPTFSDFSLKATTIKFRAYML